EDGRYQLKINIEAIASDYANIAAAIDPTIAGRYQAQVLFIKGADSDYLQADDRDTVLQYFPQARLKSIAGAGHWPHSEKPEVVFKIISDFLTQSSDA
ncbi:MAG: alpha/beta hydrolase, partial [Pseudomonadota bacterium]